MTNITEIIPDNMPDWMIKSMADGQLFNEVIKREEQCICKVNWQPIIKECEQFLDKMFLDDKEEAYRFIGVMHSEDDYYYCMMGMDGKLVRVSCVMNLESFGYKLSLTLN